MVSTYPSSARFRSGDGGLGEVLHAADIAVGIAGSQGKFAAFAPDRDIPALFRNSASEALVGHLDFPRDVLFSPKRGVATLLRVNRMERYTLRVVDFGQGASRKVRRPVVPASYSECAFTNKPPNLSDGGLRAPYTEDCPNKFEPPRTFTPCKAATLGDAMGSCLSEPERIVMKLRVNRGHSSAQQL